jgi:hypothetical protein
MQTINEPVRIAIKAKKRDYYVVDKYLGGLIKVRRVVKTDTLRKELYIIAPKTDVVFLNGKEIHNADQ